MCPCPNIANCSYLNVTLKNDPYYIDVFRSNFCAFHYNECAIFKDLKDPNGDKCHIPFVNKPHPYIPVYNR